MLSDNMNNDPVWDNTSYSYNPLILLKLIVKTIVAQTEDQYFYATVYNQECAIYGFQQHNLKNEKYYDLFNYKVDVG